MFFMVPHIMITVAKKLIRFQVKERQQNQRKSNRRGGGDGKILDVMEQQNLRIITQSQMKVEK